MDEAWASRWVAIALDAAAGPGEALLAELSCPPNGKENELWDAVEELAGAPIPRWADRPPRPIRWSWPEPMTERSCPGRSWRPP